jgi:endonuclease I
MKKISFSCLLFVFAISAVAQTITPAASLPDYYADLQDKSGKSLFDALHVVTKKGYTSLDYTGLWTAYQYSDLRDNGTVWDMYSDCDWTYRTSQCGTYSDECDCYNREHSIPKSWFGGSQSQNTPGTDIFHVVPTDGYVNGRRSNYAYGEVNSISYTFDGAKLGTAKNITIVNGNTIAGDEGTSISASGTVFEPRDEYKGDFARGYLGTMIRWAGDYQTFTQEDDGRKIFSTTYDVGSFGLTSYGVALLMKWHRQDPVSQKEIDRNNGIQQMQGNRNPFIDYPYLAEYIWGEKAGETLDLSKLITAYDSRFVLGQSNGSLEGGSAVDPVEKCTVTWMVNGEEYVVGSPTISVTKGGVIYHLPTAPKSCDEISTQFVGWTEFPIDGTQDLVPTDLFSTADDAPDITQNTTFHAVFAQLTEEEGPVADSPVIGMNLDSQDGWTLSGLIKDTKHWRVVKDAYIESPQVDLPNITNIEVNMRTYGGANFKTLEFSMNDTLVGQIDATTNKLKNYTWTPTSTLSGSGKLRFSSTTCTAENGPALSSITINLKTGVPSIIYVYSRYITSCSNQSTDVVETIVEKTSTKMMRDGQLLIEHNGVYYNTLGQPLTF